MAYKITQSIKPPGFNSGLLPVLYAYSGGLLLGDSTMKKYIKLTQGKFAIVDDIDYEKLSRFMWQAAKKKYKKVVYGFTVQRSCRCPFNQKRTIFMHRQIMSCPRGKVVDHIDHNPLNNQRTNLRICSKGKNNLNKLPYAKGSSKYKGVSWHYPLRKWRSQIQLNNQRHSLGYFIDEIKAAKIYDIAAKKLFGEFAHLNFP